MCPNRISRPALATITVMILLTTIPLAWAAAPTNACALLSVGQVGTILGVQVDAGKNLIGPNECRWKQMNSKPGSDAAMLQVNLSKAQAFEMGKTAIPNWTKTPITGLGDDAYSANHGGKMTFPISPSLSVKKGAVFLVISAKVPKATLEQTKELEKRIAGAILSQL